MQATLDKRPWLQDFELRLGARAGRKVIVAVAANGGEIEWREIEHNEEAPVFAIVSKEVLSAIAVAAGEIVQASDQTLESLGDARQVRDRALGMVERIVDADLAREASSRG